MGANLFPLAEGEQQVFKDIRRYSDAEYCPD
jgi:hypothetical protein